MLASWLRVPLLLILAALAFAGGAADRLAWPATGIASAAAAPGSSGLVESTASPEQPAPFAVVRVVRLTTGSRSPGEGPRAGKLRHGSFASIPTPLPRGSLTAVRLFTSARFRLGSVHDEAMSRAGSSSSFGTSLPPPSFA